MKDVPPDIKSERLHRLLEAGEVAAAKFVEKNIGSVQNVIFEDMEGDCTAGYTGSYIKVYCAGDLRGKICNVRLVKPFKDGAFGEVIF